MSGSQLITMGCRLNFAESEAMRLLASGEDDLIIVNSCAVTAEAVRQTRQAIRKAKRARPEARVMVTGCAAQIEPGTFAAMPEVARVLGNRLRILWWIGRKGPRLGHHAGAGDGATPRARICRAIACVRRGAERVRSPLHLLHHTLWPREQPLGAGRAGC
jgi:hypothetical protein